MFLRVYNKKKRENIWIEYNIKWVLISVLKTPINETLNKFIIIFIN